MNGAKVSVAVHRDSAAPSASNNLSDKDRPKRREFPQPSQRKGLEEG